MKAKNKEHSKKLHILVEQSRALWPYKNNYIKRRIYVESQLIKPTASEQEKIDIHLEAISMLRSNQGIDSTKLEKYQFIGIERYHLEKIKQIHEGYYWSIDIQSESYGV